MLLIKKYQIPSLVTAGGIILSMMLPLPWLQADVQSQDSNLAPFLFLVFLIWIVSFSLDAFITYQNRHLIKGYETNLILWKLGKIKNLPTFAYFPIALTFELALAFAIPFFFLRTFDINRTGLVLLALAFLHVYAYLSNRKFTGLATTAAA